MLPPGTGYLLWIFITQMCTFTSTISYMLASYVARRVLSKFVFPRVLCCVCRAVPNANCAKALMRQLPGSLCRCSEVVSVYNQHDAIRAFALNEPTSKQTNKHPTTFIIIAPKIDTSKEYGTSL